MPTSTPVAPAATTTTAAPVNGQLTDVIDAMRDIQTEGDRWRLADRLATMIPTGASGFDRIMDKATQEGVAGSLSANTLRLYRDTSVRWPTAKRTVNVGFSCYREAERMLDTHGIDEAVKLLENCVAVQGAGKVTVASVRKAVAIKQNKVSPAAAQAAAASSATVSTTMKDVLSDLSTGGQALIQAIPASTSAPELDMLHAGLTKVLQHVERLRSKAAQKASASKAQGAGKGTAQAAPAKAAAPTTTTPAKGEAKAKDADREAGDLRGL
jgi:hypothetical protein